MTKLTIFIFILFIQSASAFLDKPIDQLTEDCDHFEVFGRVSLASSVSHIDCELITFHEGSELILHGDTFIKTRTLRGPVRILTKGQIESSRSGGGSSLLHRLARRVPFYRAPNGNDGSNGGNGRNATCRGFPPKCYGARNGQNGGHGANGRSGRKGKTGLSGKNGSFGFNLELVVNAFIEVPFVYINMSGGDGLRGRKGELGGNGGNGGNGGVGGKGGAGKYGRSSGRGGNGGNGGNGGHGGDGGTGGRGGHGGNAGNIIFSYIPLDGVVPDYELLNQIEFQLLSYGGKGGAGGVGGKGGVGGLGGTAGRGGQGGNGTWFESDGAGGLGGRTGTAGIAGKSGINGISGRNGENGLTRRPRFFVIFEGERNEYL